MKQQIIFIELLIANKTKCVCDISEHLYNINKTVSIFVKDLSELGQLDERLWTWKQESFVPHSIQQPDKEAAEPVRLTSDSEQLPSSDIIILNDPIPLEKLTTYKLIIDFAEVYHAERIEQSRERFRVCRDAGYPVEFLKLGAFMSLDASALT